VARTPRLQIKHHFINVTPTPTIGRIIGFHDGMRGRMIMLGRMFIFGAVTTTDMPASTTDPKMYPAIAALQTFFTTIGGGCHVSNGIKMSAFHCSLPIT
jgi:hypothetical protein